MADDIKVLIEGELTEQTLENIKEGISDSVSKGLEGKEQEFANVFNFKNIKKELGSALNSAWSNSLKVQARQAAAMDKYKKSQAAVTQLVNSGNKGAVHNAKVAGAIAKQGMAGLSGMMANINPYVLAITAAAEAAKFMADQFVRISKESAKFVGQGSLFTDKGTMDMMQRTGQTATQAQATQRSLGDLGLDFSDIQQGKITAEQAAAFEQIRQRELEKLEEINKVAGPMFKSMQQVSLGFTLLLRDINDWITMAFAQSDGINKFIESIKQFITPLAATMKSLINGLAPVFSLLGTAFSNLLKMLQPFLMYIQYLFNVLGALFSILDKVATFISDKLTPVFDWLTEGMANFFNFVIDMLKGINILGWEPFKGLNNVDLGGIGTNNTNSTVMYSTTSNYNYGSQSMSSSSTAPRDLFSSSYSLIND